MKSKNLAMLKLLPFLVCGLLVSCTSVPNVPGCTPFADPGYFKLRDVFFKVCADDPVCNANMAEWKDDFANWTVPSKSGMCILLTSGDKTYVDKDNPYNGGIKWADLVNKSIYLPASSWAKIQTYIENNCHQNQNCGKEIGNWQQTVQSIDEQLK